MGVNPTATEVEIKSAFFLLTKDCEPGRGQLLSEACEAVGDVDRRAAYDCLAYEAEDSDDKLFQIEPVCCSVCGRAPAQPRYAVFRKVVSFILVTRRRPVQGIFCALCARKQAFKVSLISAAVGWWCLPFGPIITVFEITRNAFGGYEPPGSRQALQWRNALAYYHAGNVQLAFALARELASASDQKIAAAAVRLMDRLKAQGVPADAVPLKSAWAIRPQTVASHALIACVPPGALLTLLLSDAI